jgi:hypothetical protein
VVDYREFDASLLGVSSNSIIYNKKPLLLTSELVPVESYALVNGTYECYCKSKELIEIFDQLNNFIAKRANIPLCMSRLPGMFVTVQKLPQYSYCIISAKIFRVIRVNEDKVKFQPINMNVERIVLDWKKVDVILSMNLIDDLKILLTRLLLEVNMD